MSALLSQKTEGLESTKIETRSKAEPLLAGFAFVLGLLPCLFHNLLFCESRIMLATDGKHFLHTVGLLVEYFKRLGAGELTQRFLTDSQLCGHIIFDGPLLSLIYSPLFLLLNKVPTPRDWTTLALGQSFFHALSTALLTVLVLRLTRSKLFALMACLLYGLYPPAVLQSGHFMSELPVTSILLAFFLCICPRKTASEAVTAKPYFLSGILAALLILSKPALIPCVGLLSVFALCFCVGHGFGSVGLSTGAAGAGLFVSLWTWVKARAKHFLSMAGGLSLVLSLWSVFCFNATGNVFPTAQRQPLYNVVSGWNYEADGWAHNPHPPLTEMYSDADGPVASAAGIWISHSQDSLRLAVSKVSRLISCPWNDFKGRALGIDENAQILIHRLIIACAAFGASIYLFCRRRYLDGDQRRILEMAALLIVCHFSYIMVECQPRYTFTAMPLAVLLAVYGIWQASRLSFQDPLRRISIAASVALALALTAFLMHAENLVSFFDPRALKEKSHTLFRQDSVEKTIDLSAATVPLNKIGSVVLLVDGDKSLEKSKIEVNGLVLKQPLLPAMHFDAAHYVLYDQLREFGPSMRISVDDFRQWRAVPLDPASINWTGKNQIVIKNQAKEGTIYGDGQKSRYMLSPDYCNYGVLAASPLAAGAESRYRDPILTASTEESSSIHYKTEPKNPLKDSLRIRLLVNLANESKSPTEGGRSGSAGGSPADVPHQILKSSTEPSITKVPRSLFDRMLWDNNSSEYLRINKVILYAARTVAANVPLPASSQTGSHLKLRIKGQVKALKNAGDVGLLCAVKGKNGTVQILGKTPRALIAGNDWSEFKIDDLIPLSLLGGRAESIELALYPCPWMEGQYGVSRRATDALFRDIVIESGEADLPELSKRRIIY